MRQGQESSPHSLATDGTSPSLAVCIATSSVTQRSGPTRCGCFTSLSEGLLTNESPTTQRI